ERKETSDYKLLQKFELLIIGTDERLIKRLPNSQDNILYIVNTSKMFDIIDEAHERIGHGGRDRTLKEIKSKYFNITEECVDLIDYQSRPDGSFRFVMNYQDHFSKFIILRPLTSKRAAEVAVHSVEMFCMYGAPCILQSDNGREFVNEIVEEVKELWPGLKICHGRPRHPQSQGSVEKANDDVERKLAIWMKQNKTSKWSAGLPFVMHQKNTSHHSGINTTVMFGCAPKLGLSSLPLPSATIDRLTKEEELLALIGQYGINPSGDTDSSSDIELSDGNSASNTDKTVPSVNNGTDDDMEVENNNNDEHDSICHVCTCRIINMSEAFFCKDCTQLVHLACTNGLSCERCYLDYQRNENRNIANTGQEKQAKRMTARAETLSPLHIGDNVRMKIPSVDRSRVDPLTILGVVVNVDHNGLHTIGCRGGTINTKYNRKDLEHCETILKPTAVDSTSLPRHSIVANESLVGGQGLFHCDCRPALVIFIILKLHPYLSKKLHDLNLSRSRLPVIPQPFQTSRLSPAGCIFTFSSSYDPKSPFSNELKLFHNWLRQDFSYFSNFGETFTTDHGQIELILEDEKGEEEGYRLNVNEKRIEIRSRTKGGIFYGLQTVRQLITIKQRPGHHVPQLTVPCIQIIDRPRFVWRSFMLDSARHFRNISTIKQLLDEMAALKMNRFHWHLTDDQGWRIEIKKYPKLTEIGSRRSRAQIGGFNSSDYVYQNHSGFYSQIEIRDLIQYAKDRYITIVPEIEMPGHASAAIAAYPWLGCTKQKNIEVPGHCGVHYSVFDVSSPRVIDFIHDILSEVMSLFSSSNVIHIGGDEVKYDQWKSSPNILKFMSLHQLKTPSDLQVWFTNKISNFISSGTNKRMMGWNEIMGGSKLHNYTDTEDVKTKEELAKNTIVQFWK
ncbi:unnamed protein product, partial [Didymodactylos carnosus]